MQQITNKTLRILGAGAISIAFGLLAMQPVQAQPQSWPDKPVKIIVSFAPGGVTDTVARALQPKLSEELGQPVIIENRPGAGGTLAEGLLARSPSDGYTMMLTADGVPANPHLNRNLPYDTFKDLMPVSMLVRIPLALLVHPSVPANNLGEFISHVKSQQGKFSYASPGTGTSNHLFMEAFKDMANIDMSHVAYKGGGPAMGDLMGGHVQAILISATLAAPQVTSGKVKAVAVTSPKRIEKLPQVATFAESGYANFQPHTWTGLFLPAGTPKTIVDRLHAAYAKALKAPEVVARMRDLNAEIVMDSPAEFTKQLRADYDAMGKLIRDRNIGS